MRSDGGPRRWRRWAAAVAFTACVVAAVFWFLTKGDGALGQADQIASVVGGLSGLAGFYLAFSQAGRKPAVEPAGVAERLARAVRARLARDPVFEHLQPSPLQVRWSSTRREVAADPDLVLGPAATDWREAPLIGQGTDVVEAFRSLPHGQLVIIGAAGAGKSVLAMSLTQGLLDAREDGAAVPVLLSIASWNPDREGVNAFVARRLEEEYEVPRRRDDDGGSVARRLVDSGVVLPVLDGLDEMPEAARKAALKALDKIDLAGRRWVLTCRSEEYQRVVTDRGTALARAAVVELEPVGAEQVIAFLTRDVPARARWQPVFDRIREDPSGPLATVLSTPLMAALARTAYRPQHADPRDLLALTDEHAVTESLIEKYVHSVYEQKDGHAGRWLACLAYQVFRVGTRELAWWELRPGLFTPDRAARESWVRWGVLLAGATAAGAVGALVAEPGKALPTGLSSGLGTALTAGLVALAVLWLGSSGAFRALWPGGYPPYVSLHYRSRARRPLTHVGFGAVFGIAVGVLSGPLVGDIALGLLAGCAHGLVNSVLPDLSARGPAGPFTPRMTLNVNRRNMVVAAVQHGLIAAGVFSAVALIAPWTWRVFPVAVVAAVVFGSAAALSAGLWTWTRFRLAHAGLAAVGWLPWRLFAFLDGAQDRGVLRPAGTVWQFRHALVQDHLAYSAYRTAFAHHPDADRSEPAAPDQVQEDGLVEASHGQTLQRILAWQVAGLLARGRVEEAVPALHAQAATGDRLWQMASSRADQGDVRGAISALGSVFADVHMTLWRSVFHTRVRPPRPSTGPLVEQLRRGRYWGVRPRPGSRAAGRQLADLLVELGLLDELEDRAAAGDWAAADRLAELRAEQGDLDGAVRILRVRAAAGDEHAAVAAAELLSEHGRGEDAITILRDHGGLNGARAFYWLLAEHGHVDELRGEAEHGKWLAAEEMPVLLERFGHLDELRAQADAGSWRAAERFSRVLAEEGRFDELQARADAGDWYAGEWLAVRGVPRPWRKSAPAPRRVVLPPVAPVAEPEPDRSPPSDESVLVGTVKLVWRLGPHHSVHSTWFTFFAAIAFGGAVGSVWNRPDTAGAVVAAVLAGAVLLWLLPLLRKEPATWAVLTWRAAPKPAQHAALALVFVVVPVLAAAGLVLSAPLTVLALVPAYLVVVLVAFKVVSVQEMRWRVRRETSV